MHFFKFIDHHYHQALYHSILWQALSCEFFFFLFSSLASFSLSHNLSSSSGSHNIASMFESLFTSNFFLLSFFLCRNEADTAALLVDFSKHVSDVAFNITNISCSNWNRKCKIAAGRRYLHANWYGLLSDKTCCCAWALRWIVYASCKKYEKKNQKWIIKKSRKCHKLKSNFFPVNGSSLLRIV